MLLVRAKVATAAPGVAVCFLGLKQVFPLITDACSSHFHLKAILFPRVSLLLLINRMQSDDEVDHCRHHLQRNQPLQEHPHSEENPRFHQLVRGQLNSNFQDLLLRPALNSTRLGAEG